MRIKHYSVEIVSACLALALMATQAWAVNVYWTSDNSGGDFNDHNNWVDLVVPGVSDAAVFTNTFGITVTSTIPVAILQFNPRSPGNSNFLPGGAGRPGGDLTFDHSGNALKIGTTGYRSDRNYGKVRILAPSITNAGVLYLRGEYGSLTLDNQVWIQTGGGATSIGQNNGANLPMPNNCLLLITNGASMDANAMTYFHCGNGLIASLWRADSNRVEVTGSGSSLKCTNIVSIGLAYGSDNSLIVDDGGTVLAGWLAVNASGSSSNNWVRVGGNGTGSTLTVLRSVGVGITNGLTGTAGDGGRITVNSGGTIVCKGKTAVGNETDPLYVTTNCLLRVDGGTYVATNDAGVGQMIAIGPGSKLYLGGDGTVTAGQLYLSTNAAFGNQADAANSGFTSGTLNLDSAVASLILNVFSIGDNAGAPASAIYNMVGGNAHQFGLGVVVQSDGLLAGSGPLTPGGFGLTNNGIIAPGAALGGDIGTVSAVGNVVFSSGSTLQSGVTNDTKDLVAITGNLDLSGAETLAVIFSGAQTASRYVLLSYTGARTGTFDALNVSGGSGTWAADYSVANEIAIKRSTANYATNITFSVSGGGTTLNLTWPETHLGWMVQHQSNPLSVGLSNNWVDLPATAASTSYSTTINPAAPTEFFRLRSP